MIRPVILSGGGGTRLWPLSRTGNPKQFQQLLGDKSLLQATVQAMSRRPVPSSVHLDWRGTARSSSSTSSKARATRLMPFCSNRLPGTRRRRSRPPPIGRFRAARTIPLLVMPSDHLIEDAAAFHAAVEAALPSALDGKLLTFGIQPTRPHTGYGYIHAAADDEVGGAPRRTLRRETKRGAAPSSSSKTAAIIGTAGFSCSGRVLL